MVESDFGVAGRLARENLRKSAPLPKIQICSSRHDYTVSMRSLGYWPPRAKEKRHGLPQSPCPSSDNNLERTRRNNPMDSSVMMWKSLAGGQSSCLQRFWPFFHLFL